jgi:hypothetical protein
LAGTGAGASDDVMEDISNNPLIGRKYYGKHAGFIPKYRDSAEATYTGYYCNPQSGIILAKASESLIDETKKPPPANFFSNAKSTRKCVLEPGIIRKDTIASRKKCNLNEFMSLFRVQIDRGFVANTEIDTRLGVCSMFGLEKALNSRASEADISVAWELNQKICCSGYYRKGTLTVPLLEIN